MREASSQACRAPVASAWVLYPLEIGDACASLCAARCQSGRAGPAPEPCAGAEEPLSLFVQEENEMTFRPLHDRILVRRIDAEETTAGSLIIPDSA